MNAERETTTRIVESPNPLMRYVMVCLASFHGLNVWKPGRRRNAVAIDCSDEQFKVLTAAAKKVGDCLEVIELVAVQSFLEQEHVEPPSPEATKQLAEWHDRVTGDHQLQALLLTVTDKLRMMTNEGQCNDNS